MELQGDAISRIFKYSVSNLGKNPCYGARARNDGATISTVLLLAPGARNTPAQRTEDPAESVNEIDGADSGFSRALMIS